MCNYKTYMLLLLLISHFTLESHATSVTLTPNQKDLAVS